MRLLKQPGISEYNWRGVLIVVAICSLTVSLATRFYTPFSSKGHVVRAVERRSAEPKRQHLDRDATHWVAPVASFTLLEPSAVLHHVTFTGPLLPNHVFDESLYNRPPPSSEFFL
jgi:hypothetical protein